VHERERAVEPLVGQVEEELAELQARQHPLVDQGPPRQRGEVDGAVRLAGPVDRRRGPGADLVLDALPDHEGAALEVEPGERVVALTRGDEQLAEGRFDVAGHRADRGVVDGDVPPADHPQPLVGHDRVDRLRRDVGLLGVLRQEDHPDRVGPGLR
jgi:hypothetical protein